MLLPVLLKGERIVIQPCAVDTLHAQPMGAARFTEFVTASRVCERCVTESANAHGTPFCEMVTNWPAISTVPARERLVGLPARTRLTEPLLVRFAEPEIVIQLFVFSTVQAQPFNVVTLIVLVDVAGPFVMLSGSTVKRHGAASCVMVKTLSAICTVAVRFVPLGFAANV